MSHYVKSSMVHPKGFGALKRVMIAWARKEAHARKERHTLVIIDRKGKGHARTFGPIKRRGGAQ